MPKFEEAAEQKPVDFVESSKNLGTNEVKDEDKLSKELAAVRNREELFGVLDKTGGIEGSKQFFTAEELKQLITAVLDKGERIFLGGITRTGGLRKKVEQIMDLEKREANK